MEFLVYLNGASRGPFEAERLRALLAARLLQPSDLACEACADGEWKPLSSFGEFQDTPAVEEAGSISQGVAAPIPPPPLPIFAPPPSPTADLRPLPIDTLGPYSRANLAPNETPYFKTSLHWFIFARFAALAFVLFLLAAIPFAIGVQALTGSELGWFALPLPAFILLPPTLAFASSELVITDRRVLIKTGIVRRQTVEMFISKVESIAVDQGFLGRVFDFGTVTIRGTGGFEEAFESIASPLQFRSWIQRLQSGMQAA